MIQLLRLQQWIKNLFVFLPILFSGDLLNPYHLLYTFLAFMSFCFAASSIYCFNDIIDVDLDRQHPIKKNRSIASGRVTIPQAYLTMSMCLVASISLVFLLPKPVAVPSLAIIGLYLALNILYCLWLKKLPIIDLVSIAIGYVLRILIGACVIDVVSSHWILIVTFLLAFFLGLSKRRDDVVLMQNAGIAVRSSVKNYNLQFIDCVLAILAALILITYLMYTLSEEVMVRLGNRQLYISGLFVFIGILRYLQRTMTHNQSISPTKLLLSDTFIQLCIAGWLLVIVFLIYIRPWLQLRGF